MNKMYLFLHDCDIHSSVNYLLLSLMIYLVGLFVFQIITKSIQKKKARLEKGEQENKENFPEIYESILNSLWKTERKYYISYKIMPSFLFLYIAMNVISFIMEGKLFKNPYILLVYCSYPIITLPIILNAYSYFLDRNKWDFDQGRDVATITDKYIIEDKDEIRIVLHYNDSNWAFLSGKTNDEKDGRVIAMEEIIEKHKMLKSLYILPSGYKAEKINSKWVVTKYTN